MEGNKKVIQMIQFSLSNHIVAPKAVFQPSEPCLVSLHSWSLVSTWGCATWIVLHRGLSQNSLLEN